MKADIDGVASYIKGMIYKRGGEARFLVDELARNLKETEAFIDQLPITTDGVRLVPGREQDRVWLVFSQTEIVSVGAHKIWWDAEDKVWMICAWPVSCSYSTEQAARAAMEPKPNGV